MLSRALATLAALLLACACPQASAYVRAEHVADADDHLTRYTDARGFVHDYTIDALGRKTGEADPTVSGPGGGSFRQSWAYDTQDNVLRVEDRLGIADTYSYDRENRLLSRSRDGERKLTQTYDVQGNLLTQSDANGQITRFEYDAANRRTLTLRLEGIREALTYTADDDVATRTDALSRVWRNGYDVRRRLRSERNPAADELTEHEYDNANNRVLTRRPLLQTWAYAYDGADRLRAVTSPLTWQTTYRYDLAGNRIEEKNARDHTITQTFDVLNRRSTRTLDATSVQHWTYDGANNLIREETPNGAQIDSSYDELNRRVSRLLQGAAAPGAWSGSRFNYDANGKVLTESTEVAGLPAWTRTRQYDRQERLIFERDGDGATLATTYDPQNNRLTLTDSAGDLTRYTYDHANRLTSVAAPAIGTTEYRYNTASQLIERTGQGGYTSVTAYDLAGRVQRIEHRIGGTPTLTLEYDYDRNGNRAEQRLTHAGSGLERTSYAYDNADRLTRSTRTPPTGNALETTWTLDAVGNRTLEEVRELGSLTQRTAYSYDLRDRLQTATPELPTGPPTAYQYDADGNVSSEQIGSAAPTQYRWDARDRLSEYTPAGAPVIRNRYDESDRRIAREDAATGSRYRWDGNAVIEETNALGNRLTRYHRGIGLIGATSATTQPDPRLYASDAQDTPLALIRPDGGIAGRASFDIWGKSTSQSGEQSKLGFTGYQKETGDLYQAVARYYRPGTGSFLSTDPWEGDYNNPASLHKYLYGYGNPGIFVDPDGRCVWDLCIGELAAVAALTGVTAWAGSVIHEEVTTGADFETAATNMQHVRNGAGAAGAVFSGGTLGLPITAGLIAIGGGADVAMQMNLEGRAYDQVDYARAVASGGITAGGGALLGLSLASSNAYLSGLGRITAAGLTARGAADSGHLIGEGLASGNKGEVVLGGALGTFSLAGGMAMAPRPSGPNIMMNPSELDASLENIQPSTAVTAENPNGSVTLNASPKYWNSPVEVAGRRVYQRTDLFDPDQVSQWKENGKLVSGSNVERMASGRAPVGTDGRSVGLHHLTQTELNGLNGTRGSLAEVGGRFHSENTGVLHMPTPRNPNIPKQTIPRYPSFRRNADGSASRQATEFAEYQQRYWELRAEGFIK